MPVTVPRRNKKPELPTNIILHHILPRLPAKSVLRLTTVSKEFHSFLKSHQFAKMHLRHATNDDHRHKFLVLSNDTGRWLFSSIDCETTKTTPDGHLITPPPSRPVPFLTDLFPYMRVLTSFHGLLCVGITSNMVHQTYRDLILWNPATGDYKILSEPNVVIRFFEGFGLYYSSCDDDYKLLHVTESCEVYKYSLRFDSWTKLYALWLFECRLIVNENLYVLGGWQNSTLIRFDTITEKITNIKLPLLSGGSDFRFVYTRLFVHKGYIHLCVRFWGIRGNVKYYETWRMNGDDGDWSMVDTYDMYKEVPWTRIRRLKRQQHLMKNGEWLMIHSKDAAKNIILCVFDPEKKAYTYTYMGTDNNIPEEGRYTETLVSPNQYMLA